MNEIPLIYFLAVAAFLFGAGLLIVIIKRNAVFVLMGIELMLNAAHLNFAAFSRYDRLLNGQITAIFSVVLAAAEAAIALAILLNIYRQYQSTDIDDLTELRN